MLIIKDTTPSDEEVTLISLMKLKLSLVKENIVRKNYFPDFDRGSLKEGMIMKKTLDIWQGSGGRYVELTEFGKEFINANIEGKQIAFTKYIDKLLGGYVSILKILLHDFKRFC